MVVYEVACYFQEETSSMTIKLLRHKDATPDNINAILKGGIIEGGFVGDPNGEWLLSVETDNGILVIENVNSLKINVTAYEPDPGPLRRV
jgi:hypothetical protein